VELDRREGNASLKSKGATDTFGKNSLVGDIEFFGVLKTGQAVSVPKPAVAAPKAAFRDDEDRNSDDDPFAPPKSARAVRTKQTAARTGKSGVDIDDDDDGDDDLDLDALQQQYGLAGDDGSDDDDHLDVPLSSK
jgi:hypothetical protein